MNYMMNFEYVNIYQKHVVLAYFSILYFMTLKTISSVNLVCNGSIFVYIKRVLRH